LTVHVLFGLLHRNVHVTIQTSQNTWSQARVTLQHRRKAQARWEQLLQETAYVNTVLSCAL
jgi:hypothetical protein